MIHESDQARYNLLHSSPLVIKADSLIEVTVVVIDALGFGC